MEPREGSGDQNRAARLRPGHHLYHGPDGLWRLSTPAGGFIRLGAPPEAMGALAEALAARRALEDEDAAALLARFIEHGYAEIDPATPVDVAGGRIALLGANAIADLTGRLLGEAGVGVWRVPDDARPAGAVDLVIACADWLPDARWVALDRWCRERGIAWHGCYAEGCAWYLGPLAIPGRTAGYADARARRLAAAAFPHELEAYWRYLESGAAVPALPCLDTGATAIVAGALVADALAFLRGAAPPSEGTQLAFDPARLGLARHPVLPVPGREP